MDQITRVGVDLAKRVIQVHAVNAAGRVASAKALSRDKFAAWCVQLPPSCLIVMEACSGGHHWARKLKAMGLDARLVAGHFVGAYRMQGKCGKNDANDAAAICEAAGRPHMRFVPVKTLEQQAQLAVHRLREGYKEERTACINRIRGLLAEFGLVFPQSPDALRRALPEVLEDADNELPGVARLALQRAQLQWVELDCHIAWCDERIAAHVRSDEQAQAALQLCGVGPVTASALAASVGDFRQFKTAAQFGAWLGLVPSQNSSGGKASQGGHHQARRRVPANTAGARRQVGRDDGAQTQRPDLAVVGATDGAGGLAEGGGGPDGSAPILAIQPGTNRHFWH
jgi:transposase